MHNGWHTLTKGEQEYFKYFYSNGYGTRTTGVIIRKLGIENIIGTRGSMLHDYDFHIGGDINAFVRANLCLVSTCTEQMLEKNLPLWKNVLGFAIIMFFYLVVSTIGLFYFQWK